MGRQAIYKWVVGSLAFIAIAYACTQVFSVLRGRKQHDFRIYYYAVRAYQQEMDPYDLTSLQRVSGNDDIGHPFVYPPHCLFLFKPFAELEYKLAYFLFLAIKLLAIAGLVLIWTRIVPVSRADSWALLVTVLLGYRSAVLRDLRAGNVSIFEQLFLWGGILLLLKQRTIAGAIGILLSSVFKVLTCALAPLVLVINRTWRSLLVLVTLALGCVLGYLASYTASQGLWTRFISAAGGLDERPNRCPSSLSLLRDAAKSAGIGDDTVYVVYGLLCCVILGLWLWAFWQTRTSKDVYPMIYATIIAYVLIVPRMKDYSMGIALIPALHTISAVPKTRLWAVVGCILLWTSLFNYQHLMVSAFVFILLLHWIRKTKELPNKKMAITLNPLRSFAVQPPSISASS